MLNMAPSIHNAHKDYYMATCEFHLGFVEWHEYEYGITHILRNQPRGHNYHGLKILRTLIFTLDPATSNFKKISKFSVRFFPFLQRFEYLISRFFQYISLINMINFYISRSQHKKEV